ncbi:hypothetical protein OK074_2970 [Actinobacteria bacterium OK074]|nr:hypothetical protein OK074_2970 [Actinobacteria bacterium OK074]
MLRITDARSGEPIDIRPGLTRVHVHVAGSGTGALRVLLTADILARALELGGSPALTLGRPAPELRARADALGIRPAEPDVTSGGRALHVLATADATAPDGPRIAVAPVTGEQGGPDDPSALRLALLRTPRTRPADLAPADLTAAAETLARWRRSVALWANSPSKPVPDAVKQEVRAGWENDLDMPAVLAVLARLERAEDVPDGARFESYAYADRLLGLELTREIGAWA